MPRRVLVCLAASLLTTCSSPTRTQPPGHIVVALTTDLEGRWSRNWIQWSGLEGLWGRMLDWLSPREENLLPNYEARVTFADDRSVLELTVYDETSARSQFRFQVSGRNTKSEGTLNRLAPGHYQADMPFGAAGDYRIDLTEDRAGRKIAFPPLGYSLSYDRAAELPRPTLHTNLLARMAQASAGHVNPKSLDRHDKIDTTKVYRGLRQPLIWLAFGLFLLEIGLRKLVFAEAD